MDDNPRNESAHSHRQIPIRVKGHVEDLPDADEVLTIFGGPYEGENGLHAHDRYA